MQKAATTYHLATAPTPKNENSGLNSAEVSPPDEGTLVDVEPLFEDQNFSCRPTSYSALLNDARNFAFLLKSDLVHKSRSQFESESAFKAYKSDILKHPLLVHDSAFQTASSLLISVVVLRCEDIKAKDKNGSSNPYISVSYPSTNSTTVFQSESVQQSLNPEWNFKLTLLIRDSSEPLTISVWNKCSKLASRGSVFDLKSATAQHKHPDAFLGVVSIPGNTLIQLVQQQSVGGSLERWFMLQKRSSKSRVSGRILLELSNAIDPNCSVSQLYDSIFDCIPREPFASYQTVFQKCLDTDRASNTYTTRYLLSETSLQMMEILAKYWFIDACSRAVAELECYTRMYESEIISSSRVYFGIYDLLVRDVEDAYKGNRITSGELVRFQAAGSTAHAVLLNRVQTFFDRPIDAFGRGSADEFAFLTATLDSLTNYPLLAPLVSKRFAAEQSTLQVVEGYVLESLAIRYHGFAIEHDGEGTGARNRIVAEADEGRALVMVTSGVVEELAVFLDQFDDLILGKFHIPSMAARIYIDGLVSRIEQFADSLSTASTAVPLDIGFTVYHKVKDLLVLLEKIDFRMQEKIKLMDWFRPFLEEFVGVSEMKISEWVQNSVTIDDFSPTHIGHSSSVLDIFTSFQQQLEFLLKLEWPSDEETSMYIGKLVENIGEGLEKYALLMKQSISAELKPSTNASKPSNPKPVSPSASSTPSTPLKFQLKVRKQGPPVDPSELRVSSHSCVKLTNIDSLLQRFDDLMNSIPLQFKESLRSSTASRATSIASPAKPSRKSRKAVAQILPRVAGTLTLLHATDLHVVRPYATEVSVRICTMPPGRHYHLPSPTTSGGSGSLLGVAPTIGRELGRTAKAHQNQKLEFSSTDGLQPADIPILLTDVDIERGLQLLVVHHVPVTAGAAATVTAATVSGTVQQYAGNEYLVAMEGFAMDHVVMAAVKNGSGGVVFGVSVAGGMVMLRLVIQQGVVANIVRNRLVYVVNRMLDESTLIMVEKLCYDLRQRLKDASAGHKQAVIIANNIMNLFSSEATKKKLQVPLKSSEKPTETDVDAKLAPLLDFIDGNLSIIAETILSIPLANRVVQGLWERFVDVAEGLVVPNLGDDNGLLDKKKAWEDSRVAFLGHAVGIVKEFLQADGNGLPLEQLEIQGLNQLELILSHYSWSKKDLISKHSAEMGRLKDWSDVWMFKLLKLKGGSSDYISEAMRRKIE